MTPQKENHRRYLIAVAGLLTIVLFLQVGWFYTVFQSPDPAATAFRDWIQFHRTALRIVSGGAENVYPVDFSRVDAPEFSDGAFFLYPPFFAWLTLPLAVFSRIGAYLACVTVVVTGTLLATTVFLTRFRTTARQRTLGLLGVMASGPWNGAVILGHFSALLLISPALGLWAWSRKRPIITGLALALLLSKPNWGVPMLLFLVVGRLWKLAAGFLFGGILLVLASFPLGPGLWGAWLKTMIGYREIIMDGTRPWRQATLLATIESLTGKTGSDPLVMGLWISASVVLFGSTALAWFRFGLNRERFPRLLGVGLLAILVTNPYAYLYDAILATPLALILWIRPGDYESQTLRRWALWAFSGTYGWMILQYFFLMDRVPSLAGLGLGLWLVLELMDLSRARVESLPCDKPG